MLCGSVSCVSVEPNNNGLLSCEGYIAMIISPLFFFYSVYILLSSMNIVALDDLHGEFSMDL